MSVAASLLSNYFAKKKPNQKLKAESVWFEKSDQEQKGPDVKLLVEQIQVLATILQLAVGSTPEGDNVKYFSQLLDLKQKLKSCFQQASAGSQVTQALEHRRGYLLGKRAPIRHEYRETLLSGIPRRNEITQMSINSCKDISNYESGFLSLSEIWQLKSLRLVETARTVPHGDIEHIVKVMFLEKNPRDYLMEDMEVPDDESPVRDITNTSILVVSVSTGSGIFSLISKPPVYPLGTIFPKDLHNYELLPGGNSLFINSQGNMILLNKDQHQLPIGKSLRVRNSPWAFDALGGTENVIGQTFMTSKIPQYQNRKLYFISDDCQLVVVDARDGTQIHSFPVGPFRQDLELAEGKVHLLSERGQIAVMNEKTGGLDILGGIRGLGAREVCCGFRIFEQTVFVHGIDWFSFEVPRNFLVIGQLRRQKINFGEPFFYNPFEKFQWSNPGSEYRGHWKDGSAAFQSERNNVVGRYVYTMKEYGFSMEVQEPVDHGHNLEGVVGRGRGRGAFGRGGRGMVRGLGIAGRGGAAGMFRGFGGALVGRGGGGIAPGPVRGGAPGPVRGGAPWAVIPHPVPHAAVPLPPPAAEMDEEGEGLDDPEMDLEPPNPPANPDEGLDFEFYQNTPIPRINAGKLAFRTFVQQIKPLKYKRGMIILVLHQNGTTSLFAISNIKPYLLSTRYLSDPSMLTFRTNGMAGCLELAESPSDPLLTSHFYSKILKPNMDPLMIYGNHKYVANLVLTLE